VGHVIWMTVSYDIIVIIYSYKTLGGVTT